MGAGTAGNLFRAGYAYRPGTAPEPHEAAAQHGSCACDSLNRRLIAELVITPVSADADLLQGL